VGELRSHGWSELSAKQLGRQVNVWRMRRQLQVSELARLVGVTPSLISQIERGNAQPSVATLFALAQALDVPVDAFFGGIGGDHAESEWGSDEWLGTPRDEVSEPMADHAFFVAESERDSLETEGGVRWERLTARQIPNIDFLEIVYARPAPSRIPSPTVT
jgi:transcriptional regulator with XRE-family HTH domain